MSDTGCINQLANRPLIRAVQYNIGMGNRTIKYYLIGKCLCRDDPRIGIKSYKRTGSGQYLGLSNISWAK